VFSLGQDVLVEMSEVHSVQKIVAPYNCACNMGAHWEGVPARRFLTGLSCILMFVP